MMSQQMNDIFSTRRILSGGAPGEGPVHQRHSLEARYQDVGQVREALERAKAEGMSAMVSIGDRRLFNAMGPRQSDAIPSIWPVVPNIQGFMREAVEHGIIGAGMVRVKRVGIPALMGLGFRSAFRAPKVLKRDFPTLLLSFVELELGDFRKYNPERVFLQPQMTDLALAMNNPRILEGYADAVKRLTGAQPAYMTQNFGVLAEKLNEWGIDSGGAIAPWSSRGGGMRPDAARCESALKTSGMTVWADRSGKLEAPDDSETDYLKNCGVQGSLRDDETIMSHATKE